jgi:uncharacterized protein YfiM (DUF2279 family)
MKPSTVLLALSLAAPVSSVAADDWGGPDKTKHFAVSAVLGTLSAMHYENKWRAFGVALIPGLLKELYDSGQPGNHFSGKDMTANALGAAVGVQIGHWIVTRDGIGYQAAF